MKPKGGRARKPLVPPPLTSLRAARLITSEFHNLSAQLADANAASECRTAARLARELEARRAQYQEASVLATQTARTSKYVTATLTRRRLRPASGQPPLRLLEVGAVNLQLISTPWLAVRALDLRSVHPRIEQADALALERPAVAFDVVVCAMVLNCVPAPLQRGAMLHVLRQQLRPGGLAFVMVPLRCLTSSPFMSRQRFVAALAAAGLAVEESKDSPKVAFFCCQAIAEPGEAALGRAAKYFPDPPPRLSGQTGSNTFSIAFARQHA